MSEMKRYQGILKEIPNMEEWAQYNIKKDSFDPFSSWEEFLKSNVGFDYGYKKVHNHNGKWYTIEDLRDVYSCDEDFFKVDVNELSFDCQFYDGCHCLHDALDIALTKVLKQRSKVDSKYKAKLPTEFGDFVIHSLSDYQSSNHMIIRSTLPDKHEIPLIRIHSECLTGDVFHSYRCDCKNQLHKALERITQEGGIIFYLRQEGRGIGLENKIAAYNLQQTEGLDTQEANHQLGLPDDCRDYFLVGKWLKENSYYKVKLMSNNPLKIKALEDEGIEVIRENHQVIFSEEYAGKYLKTKKEKHNHILDV